QIFGLRTYQKTKTIEAHKGSVLGLCLSQDGRFLVSCASDRFVNVWDATTLAKIYSIYPDKEHDIGDIYCVSFASKLNTFYLGTQNASILWYNLNEKDTRPTPLPTSHPYQREDRFFDSAGPGGVRTPRPEYHKNPLDETEVQNLQIDKRYIHPFAHFGYVYCMLSLRGIVVDDPDEEILVSGGGDGSIKLWRLDARKGGAIKELFQLGDSTGDSISSLALDGTFLISGTAEGKIKVWDLETRQLVKNLRANIGDVLALSVGEGCLFAAGSSGKVETFNRQYERTNSYTAHHHGRILASGFSSIGNKPIYITGANDNSINIWDVHDCISSQPPPLSATSNGTHQELVDKFRSFVGYRTVSSLERCRTDCRRGASFLRSLFHELGAVAELLPLENPDRNPVVFATFKGNATQSETKARKRILFYGHYDVIQAENEHGWIIDPFRMEGIDEFFYGRGTSDNKGPILAAIYAVADLLAEKALDADIVFLIEGEEECGSRGFAPVVQKHKEKIGNIDWILLSNSYWLDDEVPCLTYGLRGVIHATLEIASKNPDLHSGVDGRSQGDEAMKDMINLLSSITGLHGKVNLPGFYDPIPELADDEIAHYKRITETLVSRNPALGDPQLLTKQLQQKWREPSLTVHGIETSGPYNATIIPRLVKASISLRLVPHQEASKVAENLEEFLQTRFEDLQTSNSLNVTIDHKADPWLGDYKNEIYKTLEDGIINAWPEKFSQYSRNGSGPKGPRSSAIIKPLYIREGGSIPAIRFLEKEFDAPAAHFPCGQASDNAHLDNERLRLVNLYRGREVFKWVFRELPSK
ncbi:beta-Ala-His dipeptidase, partial [Microthyrium microscopicum]